jgi:hypothetical protein
MRENGGTKYTFVRLSKIVLTSSCKLGSLLNQKVDFLTTTQDKFLLFHMELENMVLGARCWVKMLLMALKTCRTIYIYIVPSGRGMEG